MLVDFYETACYHILADWSSVYELFFLYVKNSIVIEWCYDIAATDFQVQEIDTGRNYGLKYINYL
jgi:hypothetical protein